MFVCMFLITMFVLVFVVIFYSVFNGVAVLQCSSVVSKRLVFLVNLVLFLFY